MVEGDFVDLTLPSLLSALGKEGSAAVLRMQRGTDRGALYFCEGTLVHAAAGAAVGDQAVYELLAWPDGRFRLVRDACSTSCSRSSPASSRTPRAREEWRATFDVFVGGLRTAVQQVDV